MIDWFVGFFGLAGREMGSARFGEMIPVRISFSRVSLTGDIAAACRCINDRAGLCWFDAESCSTFIVNIDQVNIV